MTPDEYRDRARRAQEIYQQALRGERPVYCAQCRRPYRALDVTRDSETWTTIRPYRHAALGSRDVCPGSFRLAWINP